MLTAPSSQVIPFPQATESRGYFKLQHSLLSSTNWQSLPALPSALFPEIAGRHNGYNNGEIPYSVRDGMKRFCVGNRAVQRAFNQLEKSGFALRTKRGTFDLKTKEAKATEWLIPSLATPQLPTRAVPRDTTITLLDKKESISLAEVKSLPNKSSAAPSFVSPIKVAEDVPRAAPNGFARGQHNGARAMDEDLHWGHIARPSKTKKELAEDWRPARELSPDEERRLADMRLWAKAHGVEMADWAAFFEIWLTKHTRKGQGNARSGSVLAAADRLIERFEREGATDYVPGSSGPQPLAVDQPPRPDGLRKLPQR